MCHGVKLLSAFEHCVLAAVMSVFSWYPCVRASEGGDRAADVESVAAVTPTVRRKKYATFLDMTADALLLEHDQEEACRVNVMVVCRH